MLVKATREGLVGNKTASGYIIDTIVPFVALPSTKALGKFVRITNPLNMKSTLAVVLDVGPWYEGDNAYVFIGQRPLAENGKPDTYGRVTNGAGIDLCENIWQRLDMKDNTMVDWEFVYSIQTKVNIS